MALLQELAQGKSLAQLVESGWRADEAEVKRIALQILSVLEYLASRRPPVVHRSAALHPSSTTASFLTQGSDCSEHMPSCSARTPDAGSHNK